MGDWAELGGHRDISPQPQDSLISLNSILAAFHTPRHPQPPLLCGIPMTGYNGAGEDIRLGVLWGLVDATGGIEIYSPHPSTGL